MATVDRNEFLRGALAAGAASFASSVATNYTAHLEPSPAVHELANVMRLLDAASDRLVGALADARGIDPAVVAALKAENCSRAKAQLSTLDSGTQPVAQRRIVEQAEDVADGIRRGADDYAANILGTLEDEAVKALAGIRKGIEVLEARRAELQARAPLDDPEPMLSDAEIRVTEDEDAGSRSPSLR